MQPFSKRPPSSDPWVQIFSWLIYAPLTLLGGCFAGRVMLELVIPLVTLTNQIAWTNSPAHILLSISTGTCMALLLAALWYRLLHRTDLWWMVANILIMCVAVYSVLFILPATLTGEHTFPLGWLPVTVASGIGVSIFQWYFLRLRTRQARWWFPLMSTSWLLIWFAVIALNRLVAD